MNALQQIECRYCGEGQMSEEAFVENIKFGRTNISVPGLLHWRCNACASVMTSAKQFEYNADLVSAVKKSATYYVSVPALKTFREKYALSQREAGKLIGAGDAAFGKYETGARMSAPTAKLIRVAMAIPEVVRMLAEEEKIDIDIDVAFDASPAIWTASQMPYFSPMRPRHTNSCQNDAIFTVEPPPASTASNWKSLQLECA